MGEDIFISPVRAGEDEIYALFAGSGEEWKDFVAALLKDYVVIKFRINVGPVCEVDDCDGLVFYADYQGIAKCILGRCYACVAYAAAGFKRVESFDCALQAANTLI